MLRAVGWVASLCFGLSLACAGTTVGGEDMGDDDAATGGKKTSPPATSPPKQCQTYAATWCEKSFGCFVSEGRLDKGSLQYNIDQCKKLIIEKLPCSAVKSVSSSYSKCLSDVKALSCSKFDVPPENFTSVPQPSSCDEVVSF
jgi:hypothetical protein